jgi:hypothetical protein
LLEQVELVAVLGAVANQAVDSRLESDDLVFFLSEEQVGFGRAAVLVLEHVEEDPRVKFERVLVDDRNEADALERKHL